MKPITPETICPEPKKLKANKILSKMKDLVDPLRPGETHREVSLPSGTEQSEIDAAVEQLKTWGWAAKDIVVTEPDDNYDTWTLRLKLPAVVAVVVEL